MAERQRCNHHGKNGSRFVELRDRSVPSQIIVIH
jgi:hypothetical protein